MLSISQDVLAPAIVRDTGVYFVVGPFQFAFGVLWPVAALDLLVPVKTVRTLALSIVFTVALKVLGATVGRRIEVASSTHGVIGTDYTGAWKQPRT